MIQGKAFAHFTPEALAAAIEENNIQCCLSWAAWPGIEVGRDGCMAWTISQVAFPYFNNVLTARLPEERIGSAIEGVIGRFRKRRVPAFWWTGPATRPVDLGRHLEAAGLEQVFRCPTMAADLDAISQAAGPPSGLVVEEVVDEAGLRAWCRVMTPVYQFPDFAAEAWHAMLASLDLGPDRPLRHFLARLEGQPVATVSLYFGADVVGVSNVATLPGYRRRGIGMALVLASLQEAKHAGCRVATLLSSVMGQPVYRRIGFRQYATLDCHLWSPPR